MRVALIVVSGKSNVREVLLGEDTLIGRSPECRLKIASTEVSRKHCRIRLRGQQVLVCDLGSSNGTLLNGKALAPMTEVVAPPKARLSIGPLEFLVDYEPAASVSPQSTVTHDADGHTIVDRVANVPVSASTVGSVAAALGSARGAVTAPSEAAAHKSDEPQLTENTLFDLGLVPGEAAPALAAVIAEPTQEVSRAAIAGDLASGSKAKRQSTPAAKSPADDAVPPLETGKPAKEPSPPQILPEAKSENADFDQALQDFLKGL
jgi:predicted component of type VI protein secretion system